MRDGRRVTMEFGSDEYPDLLMPWSPVVWSNPRVTTPAATRPTTIPIAASRSARLITMRQTAIVVAPRRTRISLCAFA